MIRCFHETVQPKKVKSWASTLPNSKDANQCLTSTDLNSTKETWPCAFLLILTVAKNLCKCKTESIQCFRLHPIHHTEVFSLKFLHYSYFRSIGFEMHKTTTENMTNVQFLPHPFNIFSNWRVDKFSPRLRQQQQKNFTETEISKKYFK